MKIQPSTARLLKRLSVLAALLPLFWLVFVATHRAPPPTTSPATPASPVTRHSSPVTPAQAWPVWGAAQNSAQKDGTGFFDYSRARQFASSVQPDLSKYVINLHARSLLPLANRAAQSAIRNPQSATSPSRTAYLQFFAHPSAAQREQLDRSGIHLLSYVDGFAWTARATPAAFDSALGLDFVRAVADIDPRDKLQEGVYRAFPYASWDDGVDKPRGEAPEYSAAADGEAHFRILTYPGTTRETLVKECGNQDVVQPWLFQDGPASTVGPRFDITADLSWAPEIAALDSVAFVQWTSPPVALRDAIIDASSNVSDVRDNPVAPSNVPLTGSGVTVVLRELGQPTAHVDFKDRLTVSDTGFATDSTSIDHSTGVCGIIASNGGAQPQAKGVATKVNVVAYSVGNAGGGPDTFATTDVLNAAGKGIRLSNHSYGPTQLAPTDFGSYQTESADWDTAIHDQDLITVWAGNEESGNRQLAHIDFIVGAKNTLCIASSNSGARAADSDENPPVTPASGISFYSDGGPMTDGRVKPDLVAFGGDGGAGSNPRDVTLDWGTNLIRSDVGTSFATPVITGVAALAFQQYKILFSGKEPSAALTKALLCNTATDLGDPGPDSTYGFGIVDAEMAVNTITFAQAGTDAHFFEGQVGDQQSATFTFSVASGVGIKATLCWMDPAGNLTASKALVNDLDLELRDPNGKLYYPFSLSASNAAAAATATAANRVDPIEQTVLANPIDGTWTIKVVGFSVPNGPQKFAVVVNAPSAQPTPPPNNPPSTPPPLAIIVASTESGPVPLSVDFAAGSPSVGITYAWSIVKLVPNGDPVTVTNFDPVGPALTYTFSPTTADLAVSGEVLYQVTLTATNSAGISSQDVKTIVVGKRQVESFPVSAKAKFDFSGKRPDDLQFSFIANDPIRLSGVAAADGAIWPRTSQQAREAIANGEFEGQKYVLTVSITLPNGTIKSFTWNQNPNSLPSDIILDRKATFKAASEDKTVSADVKLNLRNGQVNLRLKAPSGAFGFNAATKTTPKPVAHVSFSSDRADYFADFTLNYSSKGNSGSAK
ncbi:MAG TPA: S8 family serine peptidase [Planctomycetota bacterium]|jgi:hypothetical protein